MSFKFVTLPALFLLSSSACFAQLDRTFHLESPINGNPDSVITITYEREGTHDYKMSKYVYCYDDSGRVTKQYYYNYFPIPDSGIDSLPVKSVLVYDRLGRWAEHRHYFTNGKPWTEETYTYLLNGHIEIYSYYNPDNTNSHISTLITNSAERIAEKADYMKDGQLYDKSYFKYDGDGMQTEEDNYKDDGSLMFKRFYKYDVAKNIVKDSTYYDSGAKHVYTYRYTGFDEKRNWSEQIEYTNGGKVFLIRKRRIVYKN